MNKDEILAEIRRTAQMNQGFALGWRKFEAETGIGYYDWYGRYWTRWNDAVREAGVLTNRMSEPYADNVLLDRLIGLSQALGRVPTKGDLMISARNDPTFPSEKVFRRFGSKAQLAERVIAYCERDKCNEGVADLWRRVRASRDVSADANETSAATGYVYMLKHGSRREYKIGRTNNSIRREGEIGIELPEKVRPIHYIQTDDPAGVENYWHRRYAGKRKEGEWFALSENDVRAFKRWRRIY